MRKSILLILFAIILIISLCSCELSMEKPKQGKVHILVYGNDYWNIKTVNSLYDTVNDAVQVGVALSKLCEKTGKEYDATFIYGNNKLFDPEIDKTYSVIDHDTSKSSLLSHLEDLINNEDASDNDMVFIYFSGHGNSTKGGGNKPKSYGEDVSSLYQFVVTSDDNPQEHSLVYVSEIDSRIERIPGTKIVLSDFCYSGAFVSAGYVSINSLEYSDMNASELFGLRDRICEESSTFYLSASRYYELSEEEDRGSYNRYHHGVFTRSLLEALGWDDKTATLGKGGALKNGTITFYSVATFTAKNGDYRFQHPMYSGGSNDIILFSF